MVSEEINPTNETIRLPEIASTNTWMKELLAGHHPYRPADGLAVIADSQTAGRGQRGNSWEADPGLNMTLSLLLAPTGIHAAAQFAVSEVIATAAASTIARYVGPEHAAEVSVKWPNDIYVGDRKIAGILIENTLSGQRIEWSICGIGINVNQREFRSDAPNPVSIRQLTGRDTDLERFTEEFLAVARGAASIWLGPDPADPGELHRRYLSMLWRRSGLHRWRDNLRGEEFSASILSVAPTGHLTLVDEEDRRRTFAFKEVSPILPSQQILP
ncbi:MAG: biotin--[acetyl-CoA-carboxylase] ligase [Clostridium sp.]|nr:biotin--[acetyl-CoA-carboxylase] ligase [Clostridium sp.]